MGGVIFCRYRYFEKKILGEKGGRPPKGRGPSEYIRTLHVLANQNSKNYQLKYLKGTHGDRHMFNPSVRYSHSFELNHLAVRGYQVYLIWQLMKGCRNKKVIRTLPRNQDKDNTIYILQFKH